MKKKLLKIISWLAIIVIFYFLFRIIFDNWQQIKNFNFRINLYYLLFSFVIYTAVLFLFTAIWRIILKKSGHRIGYGKIFYISALARFGRYIPGGVWEYLIRHHLLPKDLPLKIFVTSCLLENILIITAGLVLSLFLVAQYLFFNILAAVVVCCLIAIFIIFPQLFYGSINLALNLIKKQPITPDLYLKSLDLLKIFIISFFGWLIWGLSFFLFIHSFVGISFSKLMVIILIFCSGLNLGRFLVFIPAGLGVNESVFTFFLKDFFNLGVSTLIALLTRIWLIVNDLIFLTVTFFVDFLAKKYGNNQGK